MKMEPRGPPHLGECRQPVIGSREDREDVMLGNMMTGDVESSTILHSYDTFDLLQWFRPLQVEQCETCSRRLKVV
jgi:hypothetical protein